TAAHGLDKVTEVILAAAEGLHELAAVVESRDPITLDVRTHQYTFRAVPDVADEVARKLEILFEVLARVGRVGILGGQATNLENQFAVAVIENANLGVGSLAIVKVAEPAADTDDRFGQLILAQAPAGLVHLVNALVAEVAIAVVPEPMPVVMDST